MAIPYDIVVRVQTQFIPEESDLPQDRYAFAYQVEIENHGSLAAQLRTRHWIITDANGQEREVRGPGVVGQQPILQPGDVFQYRSAATLSTVVGSMRGSYQMLAEDGHEFDAEIASFILAMPRSLH